MNIHVKVEKIIVRGERKIKVLGLKALESSDLPKAYTDNKDIDRCYYHASYNCIYHIPRGSATGSTLLQEQSIVDEQRLDHILSVLKKCGENLHETNKKLKKENKDWHGVVGYVI